jgi:predicted Zn-dependent peptidase
LVRRVVVFRHVFVKKAVTAKKSDKNSYARALDAPRMIYDLEDGGPRVLIISTRLPGAIAHVQVDVVVGDDNEGTEIDRKDRESAHFIEHLVASLLYSDSFPDGNAKRLAEEKGVSSNAYTSDVRTSYYMSGLDSDLETMIDMQVGAIADFERYFDSDIAKAEKYGGERLAVERELSKRVAKPEFRVYERLRSIIYAGHPRATSQRIDIEEIRKKQPDDVLRFFRQHYTPSNMLIVIASPRPRDEVKALLERRRGNVKSIVERFTRRRYPPPPDRVALRDNWIRRVDAVHVSLPDEQTTQLVMAWRLPVTRFDYDRARALRALDYLLVGGFSSRLLERLRIKDKGLVYSVSASAQLDERDAGFSVFYVETTCKASDARLVVRHVLEELRSMAKDGPTDDEMDKWRLLLTGERERLCLSRSPSRYVDSYSTFLLFHHTGAKLDRRTPKGPKVAEDLEQSLAVTATRIRDECDAIVDENLLVVTSGPDDVSGDILDELGGGGGGDSRKSLRGRRRGGGGGGNGGKDLSLDEMLGA